METTYLHFLMSQWWDLVLRSNHWDYICEHNDPLPEQSSIPSQRLDHKTHRSLSHL